MPNTELSVNGRTVSVEADPEQSLLSVLRESLGLTGTKYGCGESECGACTVLIDGLPTRSCITKIRRVGSKEITTIESLEQDGKLHPVQQAFLEESGFQCGYCTPGMIMSSVALLRKKPNPTDAEVFEQMEGHLCRCCGYPNILKAIRRAAALSRK